MPPAFPSYILRRGRRGCRERIDVSCWEVNYSNSWLQGASTVMNPGLLCGVAKAKVASGFPQEKGILGAVFSLHAKGQVLVLQVAIPTSAACTIGTLRLSTSVLLLGADQYRHMGNVYVKHQCASGLLGSHRFCAPLCRICFGQFVWYLYWQLKIPSPGLPRYNQVQVSC